MEVTGVQPVGSRSLGAVQATVSDSTQHASRAPIGAVDRENAPLPRSVFAEAVVFPRDGKPLDQRPVNLRQARANARYREDGGQTDRRDAKT